MICTPCKQAGELNTLANVRVTSGQVADNLRKLIVLKHAACTGGTWCDCQHVIGHALNELALAQMRNQPKPDSEQSPIAVDDVHSTD